MARVCHPFFHLHPSASRQIHPDIILPRPRGVLWRERKRSCKHFNLPEKITKLASQEKDSII